MPAELGAVSAISFDFYDTLAVHAPDRGRGRRLMAYFTERGWRSDPWAYEVLHDVFLGLPFNIAFWAGPGEENTLLMVASAYVAATHHRKAPAAFGPVKGEPQ